MAKKVSRRRFLKETAVGTAGAAMFLSCEEKALTDKQGVVADGPPVEGMPTGKIGNLTISRLICGGNLISGYAHARDLIYVSPLVRTYNTDEKIMDTFELCEQNGINTVIADPREQPIRVIQKYWKQRGGKMQWISEGHPEVNDLKTNLQKAIDNGASAVYVQGAKGDMFVREGHVDLLGKCVDFIKSNGLPGGIGGHMLEVVVACEKAGLKPDFYMKTLHHLKYWSAQHPERHDNLWSREPEETVEFMKKVKTPWIAFKALAAGAIHPKEGLRYAYSSGADFVAVGMFDFHVRNNAALAVDIISKVGQRERPWTA
jgi:hypothetical protein